MNTPSHAPMSTPVSCAQVRERLARYLAGALPEADAMAIEAHAGACAECEALMDETTRIPVETFAPTLPPDLRARTLAAATTRSRARATTRWIASAGTLAAAAAIFLTLRSGNTPTVPKADSTVAVAATGQMPNSLADVTAQPEFAELDRAARELEAELTKAPGDAELQTFLEAVNTRRMELERRVKDGRS